MAFNKATFNRTAFNVSGGDSVIWLRTRYNEKVTASLNASSRVLSLPRGFEALTATVSGLGVHYVRSIFAETVSEGVTQGVLQRFLETSGAEAVTVSAHAAMVLMLEKTPAETVTASVHGEAIIRPEVSGAEAVTASLVPGKYICPDASGYELVRSSVSAISTETKTCALNVTLGPGEKLIVDANYYNIYLNGESAIYIQSGDWIDELDRETLSLEVTASANADCLTASAMYTERFL